MSAPAQAAIPASGGLAPALSAVRARLGLVALLFALAAVGWWWTADRMQGMDNGPWTGLGGLGWFLGVWVVMMAAMMFSSVAPTIALYSRMTRRRSPLSPLLFAAGYLATWAVAGVLAFAIGVAVKWCVGRCWALMAALFALGIMSVVWMAVVAGLIALEKTVPWRRIASYGIAAVVLALGVLVLAVPAATPGLPTPREAPMQQMMGS